MKNEELNEELINSIIDKYNNNIKQNSSPTFLSVINKSNNENYISRILAYTLSKDKKFLTSLINIYINEKNVSKTIGNNFLIKELNCEKYMNGKRADIFLEITDELENSITLTIENKIDSWEHDNQTQLYYEWVNRNYKNSINLFYYLKPDYNLSNSVCENFIDITYSKLNELILNTNDIIILDFKSHIKQKLGVKGMNFEEYEISAIENYKTLKDIIKSTESKVKNLEESLILNIKNNLSITPVDWKTSDKNDDDIKLFSQTVTENNCIGSYRLYKQDWYLDKKYYFYIEIYFKDGTPENIYFQQTLKLYNDSNINLNEFNNVSGLNYEFQEGTYYVYQRKKFTDSNWTDANFSELFVNDAVNTLEKFIKETDKLFMTWKKWYEPISNN